ncbi:DUF4349 domain-containing protein [Aurantiacibacter sp. MUD61]|uniref:DUF4349 domain-containing protein n=1 Tax=Aurantiacibacter sp. MUD61 TaxID=3009083 RepID=UPI0022F05FB2|nr:DUF4349 domain-containing protein [Aurantiacibacter sp. MUD61]
MRIHLFLPAAALLLAAGCAEERSARQQVEEMEWDNYSEEAPQTEFGFAQAMEEPVLIGSGADAARTAAEQAARSTIGEDTQSAPDTQIAYSYSWGFQVSAEELPVLQERHRALCSSFEEGCRVISLSQSGNGDYAYGRVRMQVVADRAEEFGEALTAAGDDLDAEQISFAISGEDLTDDITDTEARLEARTELRDRLMGVLRNRQGSVNDLVQAERGVAEVNEEIDAAASRLQNMRNRVAYSSVSIEYDPQLGEYNVGFWAPIANAFGAISTTLGVTIAALIYVAVALIPITAFILGLRWLWRRTRRWREARKSVSNERSSEATQA